MISTDEVMLLATWFPAGEQTRLLEGDTVGMPGSFAPVHEVRVQAEDAELGLRRIPESVRSIHGYTQLRSLQLPRDRTSK